MMKEYIIGGLQGLGKGFIIWLLAFMLMFIPFKLFHPVEPSIFFGIILILILLYFTNKWYSSVASAKKATDEAVASGKTFVEADLYDEEKESPLKRFKNKFFHHLFMALMAGSMMACSYKIVYDTSLPKGRTVSLSQSTSGKVWSVDNIDMVHLKDSLKYVTDADHILDTATVKAMNSSLRKMDTELDIKPAFIICRQVSQSDTYHTAVDLINKYQIGSKTSGWGLCVVVAYDQKQWTIGTSREMESILTDLECNRLGESYITPFMKKNMPDSAMLYLANKTYAFLKNKKDNGKAEIEPLFNTKNSFMNSETGNNALLIMILCIVYGILNEKNKWTKIKRPETLAAATTPPTSGSSPGKKKDEKKDQPHRGGSYGGGSSGGGGATGKW